jgi:phage tail sheath protein FI
MDIQNITISDILDGYKTKKFSVSEVVNAYLERIEKLNPTLNAFITIDAENAKKKALSRPSNTLGIRIGPPRRPPNWFKMMTSRGAVVKPGFGALSRLLNQ